MNLDFNFEIAVTLSWSWENNPITFEKNGVTKITFSIFWLVKITNLNIQIVSKLTLPTSWTVHYAKYQVLK